MWSGRGIAVADIIRFIGENSEMVLTAVWQHLLIVLTAMGLGLLVALPVGTLLSYHRKAAKYILGVFGVINTIPSLVLLGVAMTLLGVGFMPAVAVLFVYSMLPVLRNTYTGLTGVNYKYIKAARGMGMSPMQVLLKVRLPLALPVIIAGIRLSVVYVVSWATLAAFIGAGGLGDLIWMGMQTYDLPMVFAGALPATVMALLASFLIGWIEKWTRRRNERTARKRRRTAREEVSV